jgi:hypothetical protein
MKHRTGFVTNSSSCSFICRVCGLDIEGNDYDSSYDHDMFQCPDCGDFHCMDHQPIEEAKFKAIAAITSDSFEELDKSSFVLCPTCLAEKMKKELMK